MAAGDTRVQKHPAGIVPGTLSEIERRVPADEAPPLAPNAELAWIGKSVPRINGRAKVTGAARFTVDVKLPGMLYGRLLRSPHPHARLASLDLSAAEKHPGVRAALPINEPVGRAVEAPADEKASGSAARRVLYVGDIVAGVAAATPAAAEAALRLIKAEYQPLPFVVDIEGARRSDAPAVFERPVHGEGYAGAIATGAPIAQRGNVRGPNTAGSRGDAGAGLALADVTVEGEYRTQVQTHCCLAHAGVLAQCRARTADDDATGLQHVAAARRLQRVARVLLDQQHAHARLVDRPDSAEDVLHDHRREAE